MGSGRLLLCVASLLASLGACSPVQTQNKPTPPLTREGVSPESRQISAEMFGEQQQTTFETFDETPSMQAGERFERDTKPVHPYDKPLPPGARERETRGDVEIR